MADAHVKHEQHTQSAAIVRIDESRIHFSANPSAPAILLPFDVLEHVGDAALRSSSRILLSIGGRLSHRMDAPGLAQGIVIPQQLVSAVPGTLVVPVSIEQLEVIDAERDLNGFTLYLWLDALADFDAAFKSPEVETKKRLLIVTSGQPPVYLRIEAEQWITILGNLGGERRRLLELPSLSLRTDTSTWSECTKRLQDASTAWRRRQYQEVASAARIVIEGLTSILGVQFDVPQGDRGMEKWGEAIGNTLNNRWSTPGEPSADGRFLLALMYAAYRWSSPSHHFGGFAFDRRTASLAFSVATDLYLFVAGLT
jgi:hypothetical protein